jgi:hypothetical protein
LAQPVLCVLDLTSDLGPLADQRRDDMRLSHAPRLATAITKFLGAFAT